MIPLSRNIYLTHSLDGDTYYLQKEGKTVGKYMTLEGVLDGRKEQDFRKKEWKPCKEVIPTEINSNLRLHYEDGLHYVELRLNNYEILVSDLYNTRKDAQMVQKFLDKHRWGTLYLNLQKRLGVECAREYSGIVPTKDGYIVVDTENNMHTTVDELEEAVHIRDYLREQGVLI